jgi:transposase
MARPVTVLELTAEEKSELQRRAASSTSTQREALRARIVLLRTEGSREADVAKALGTNVNTVSLWSKRFEAGVLEALNDMKGRERKPWLPPEKVCQLISRVTQPPKGRNKWSTRRMAAEVGIAHHSVHEIWRRNNLKPHLVPTFKISNDPKFEESGRQADHTNGGQPHTR